MDNLERPWLEPQNNAGNPLLDEFLRLGVHQDRGRNRDGADRDQRDRVNPAAVVRDRHGRHTLITDSNGRTMQFNYGDGRVPTEYTLYADSTRRQVRERWVSSDNLNWSRRDQNDREIDTWRGHLSVVDDQNDLPVIRWQTLDAENRTTLTTERDIDGSCDFTYPDGSRVQVNHLGQVTEVRTSGGRNEGRKTTIEYGPNGLPRRIVADGETYASNDGNRWAVTRAGGRAEVWEGSIIVDSEGNISFRGNDGRVETRYRNGRVQVVNTGLNYRVDQLGRVTHIRRGDDTIYEFGYAGEDIRPNYATSRQSGVELRRRPGTDQWYEGQIRRAVEPDERGVIDIDHLGRVRLNGRVRPDLFNSRANADD